jgi:hypothetical protein
MVSMGRRGVKVLIWNLLPKIGKMEAIYLDGLVHGDDTGSLLLG